MNKININQEYDYNNVEAEEVYIDTTEKQVVSKEDLQITPFDVIKAHAEKLGQNIVDPTPGCKYCLGRGFIGRDSESKAPIPCRCVQPDFNSANSVSMYNRTRKLSRKERRQLDKENRKRHKRGLI